jgi:hypothetical protein
MGTVYTTATVLAKLHRVCQVVLVVAWLESLAASCSPASRESRQQLDISDPLIISMCRTVNVDQSFLGMLQTLIVYLSAEHRPTTTYNLRGKVAMQAASMTPECILQRSLRLL